MLKNLQYDIQAQTISVNRKLAVQLDQHITSLTDKIKNGQIPNTCHLNIISYNINQNKGSLSISYYLMEFTNAC